MEDTGRQCKIMRNHQIICFLTFLMIVTVLISGCIGSPSSSQSITQQSISPTQIMVSTTKASTPNDCIIDESQTGHIEILDIKYDYLGTARSKRMVGKAKNVGGNTISGTIALTDYIAKDSTPLERTEKIFKRSSVYKFCNIEPNQEFDFILEDIGLPSIEYQPEGCCLGSLDAGQKIVTTGKGMRW